MSVTVTLSLTDDTENMLDVMSKKTGLARSEIVRRLIIAHSAGKPSTSILPPQQVDGAMAVWRGIPK